MICKFLSQRNMNNHNYDLLTMLWCLHNENSPFWASTYNMNILMLQVSLTIGISNKRSDIIYIQSHIIIHYHISQKTIIASSYLFFAGHIPRFELNEREKTYSQHINSCAKPCYLWLITFWTLIFFSFMDGIMFQT